MKEAIYGWYPSVHDIYRPKGRPSSNHLEGLYNFKNYQGQKVPHPPELVVRGVASRPTTPSCTPQDFKRRSLSVPVPKMHQQSKLDIPTPTQCWSKNNKTLPETYWGLVDDFQQSNPPSEVSWPVLDDSNQQQHQHSQKHLQHELLRTFIQQQSEKYAEDRNQTEHNGKGLQTPNQDQPLPSSEPNLVLAWPDAHKALPSRPQSSFHRQSVPCQEKNARKHRPASTPLRSSTQSQRDLMSSLTPRPPSGKSTHTTKWHVRIKSATVQSVKKPHPTRPVTAANIRQTSQEELIDSHHSEPERPPTPAPFAVKETACDLQDATILPRTPIPEEYSYEKIVEKYGWRAQIPGDPYQLKRPMKRESYTVKCSTQEPQPRPRVVRMGTKEPFFYNTIPNKPLSFSVHSEWMSEVLLAKRLELQKHDGGIKYNYKNFAFVY